jgi:hypothetical protein
MLTPEEQMQVIKGAYAEGYKGRIYELIDQASLEKSKEQGASGNTPNLPPNLQQSSMNLPFELNSQEQGNLVQSQMSTPPGMQNLNMASGENPIIQTGQYKKGGFKYENGGNKIDSDGDLEGDFNLYESSFEETEGRESLGYNQFEKIYNKYGYKIASQYWRDSEDGTARHSFQTWVDNPKRQPISWSAVGRLNPKNLDQYYELAYPDLEDREYHRNFNTHQLSVQDKQHKELGIGKYAVEDESSDASGFNIKNNDEVLTNEVDYANLHDPEFSLEEQEFYSTPETWDDFNPLNPAAAAGFAQAWNSGDRISGSYNFFDYWKGKEDTRTYAPSYRFGNDVRNVGENGANKVFYADANGNPVGTHYTDGTPYTQRILDWSKGNTDMNLAVIDDGSKLKAKAELTDDMLYRNVPLTAGAVLFGPQAVTQGIRLGSTNLIPTISGTSAFDVLGAYGMYNFTQTAPGNVEKMIDDPSWSNAGDLGWNALEIFGGASTTLNLLKNFKNTKNANTSFQALRGSEDDIIRYNTSSNRGPVKSNVSGKINTNANSGTNPVAVNSVKQANKTGTGGSSSSAVDDVVPTSEEINIIDDAISSGIKDYKINVVHPSNTQKLDNMGIWGQQWKNNWNLGVQTQSYKPYTVSGIGKGRNTMGQSNTLSTTEGSNIFGQGNYRFINNQKSPHWRNKHGNSPFLLDDADAVPRFSEINVNQNVLNLRNKLNLHHLRSGTQSMWDDYAGILKSGKTPTSTPTGSPPNIPYRSTTDDIIKNFKSNVKGTTSHEMHHTTGLSNVKGSMGNYRITGSIDDAGFLNQPGIISQEGMVNTSTFISADDYAKLTDDFLKSYYTPKFNTKFNVKTNGFDQADIIDKNHLEILRKMRNKPGGSGYTNRLDYKGSPEEITADLIGFRTKFNLGYDKYPDPIDLKTAEKIFKQFKINDPDAGAMYQNTNAFMNMFNKVPYSVVPPAIGVGIGSQVGGDDKQTQRKGGFKKKKCKYGCW